MILNNYFIVNVYDRQVSRKLFARFMIAPVHNPFHDRGNPLT